MYNKNRIELLEKKELSDREIDIDVIITVHNKDLALLPIVVESIKKNIKHKIGTIYIITTDVSKIPKNIGCKVVHEDSVLDLKKTSIGYSVDGIDRSGWIYQQFIKLSADSISDKKYILTCDADTVFVRPQKFIIGEKIVFDFSNEYHSPYYIMYERLMKKEAKFPLSFVSHHTLFDAEILKEMKKHIEQIHGDTWVDIILKNLNKDEISAFSEYETYGNYVYEHNRNRMTFRYWENLDIEMYDIENLIKLEERFKKKHLSLSAHRHK